jgi:hypothetical protein
LIALSKDVVHIQRLRKTAVTGVPDSVDQMLPTELLLGPILTFLPPRFMFEPDLAKSITIRELGNGVESPL